MVLSEVDTNAQSDVCLICFSDLGTNVRAKLPCGHDDMCGVCHLRLRHLHEDKKCPICKTTNDAVIVDSDDSKNFDSYPRWGDEIGAGFVYKSDVGMFFEEKYYNDSIVPLYEYSCHKCDFKVDDSIFVNQHLKNDENGGGKKKKKKPRRLLLDHLRQKHRLSMCQLCIDHKRDFISQLPRFTPNQLQNHLKKGDGPGSGFNGHPICEFCRPKRFYDVNFLYQHLHKEHYKCHICEKQGKDNQWFKNYGSMARHFEKQHFLCAHPQCLEARFVVFENELDLKAHEIAVHGGTSSGSTKINLEFNYRRGTGSGGGQRQNTPSESDFNYDLDGQAFVPPALTNEGSNTNNSAANDGTANSNAPNNEALLHPQHIQRTEELRAHAAAVREQQALNSQEESFPTLQAGAAPTSSSAPLVGWTSGAGLQNINRSNRRVGQVSQESFPTLPTNASNQNKKKKAIRGNIGATRRQFAAMTTSADNPQQQQASWVASSSSTGASSSNSMNRPVDLASANFPTLGRPSSSLTSASANTFARQSLPRRAAPPPSMNSASDFPSMPSSGRSASNTSMARAMASAPPPSMNSTSDFPSMQSSGRSANMARAMASAPPPSMNSTSDFPSMSSSSRSASNSSVARATKKNLKPPPSMSSASDFPAPPSAKQAAKPSVRQQMLGESDRKKPPKNNVLQPDLTAATAKATIEDMKASMGQKKFKELKKLTKKFAQEQESPEGYVDQAASLFDNGYEDQDFWSFLPSLLQSCPNQGSAQHALKYMNSLKRQQVQTSNKMPTKSTKAASSKWTSSNASNAMRQAAPPPIPASYVVPRSMTQTVATASAPRSLTQPAAMRPQTISSKKKGAWGAGGKPKVVRTNAPPGSVGAAAASQGPQGGSATKYMAKQQKKQQQAKNGTNNNNQLQKKAKKKKQKNELRDLAFGK